MIADPRAVALRWEAPRLRALAALAVAATETPWAVPATPMLSDEERVHALALAAYFGHLNRIADAVAVPLDYAVAALPPQPEPATPPYLPAADTRDAALDLALRPATAEALDAWRAYVFDPARSSGITPAQRTAIQHHVARLLGHALDEREPEIRADDEPLLELAETVTLAPWRLLGGEPFAELRELGLDDRALFDACVVASTAGMLSRLALSLAP